MKLCVVSHVIHYRSEGELYAYGPYTREIDIWADLFDEVMIASPCRQEIPPGDCTRFTRANVVMMPQKETGGETQLAKLAQIAALPVLVWGLCRAMRKADAIHVRCPGNLGLLGVLLAPLFSSHLIAKYAGQWNGYSGEERSVRWQRKVLSSRWWRGLVTVYGKWENQPPHVISFFTSMMTEAMVKHTQHIAAAKRIGSPLRVLFCGRLDPAKRVDALLEALRQTIDSGIDIEAAIVGGGTEEAQLRSCTQRLGLQNHVRFVGALPFEESLHWYEWAHCLVLPSQHSEGWPKVIAEGMCYGLACVGVAHGQIPAMLQDRGYLLETGSSEEIAATLASIVRDPDTAHRLMQSAAEWSRNYSLEGLRDSLRELMQDHWKVQLMQSAPLSSRQKRVAE